MRLGPDECCRLSEIGFEPDNNGVVTMSDVTFRLQINRLNHPFLGNIRDQIGTAAQLTSIFVKIWQTSADIRVFVENANSVDPINAFCRLKGWPIPRVR